MRTVEYGKENKEVIMFLHGGGLSWWNYREIAEMLADKYHIIIPILDGHSGSNHSFTSIEDNANRIIEYIDEKYNHSIKMIGGVSLGGQILIEMLSQRNDICEYAFIESALVIPMKLTNMLIKPSMDMSYFLIKEKWFSKLQFKSLRIKENLFNDYYKDTCAITKENYISFLKANSSYTTKEELKNTKSKVYIFVGQKELSNIIESGKILNSMIPDSILKINKEMYHGEFSINYTDKYVDKLLKVLSR